MSRWIAILMKETKRFGQRDGVGQAGLFSNLPWLATHFRVLGW